MRGISDQRVAACYKREWERVLEDVHAICPRCGMYHSFGSIRLRGTYVLEADEYYEHKGSLIVPTIRNVAPVDPKTYMNPSIALQVRCYECDHQMLLFPHHLADPAVAFNSWGLYVDGCHFNDDGSPVKRKLIFLNISELISILETQVQEENFNIDPDPSVAGIDQYCFDVSYSKDEHFADLRNIVITKDSDGDGGCIQLDQNIEKQLLMSSDSNEDVENTKEFLRGLELILELVSDYRTSHDYKGPEYDVATMYDRKYYGKS